MKKGEITKMFNKKKIGQKNEEPKKKNNIMNYAVIMIICVIIIILIAAMADDREEQIDNRILETERANESIQNEVVQLKDENYKLTKELEKTANAGEELAAYKAQLDSMTAVWELLEKGDTDAAAAAVKAIDASGFDENQKAYYDALCRLAGVEQ